MDRPRLVSTKALAEHSGVSQGLLVKLRNYRPEDSPPFIRLGRQVFYSVEAFDAWTAERLSRRAAI